MHNVLPRGVNYLVFGKKGLRTAHSEKERNGGFNYRLVPRCRNKQAVEDSQICAFELLASLARKLLLESKSSASSNASEGHYHVGKDVIKQELHSYDDKPLKLECVEQESRGAASVAASELTTENSDNVKEFKPAGDDAFLDLYGDFRGDRDRCSHDLGDLCDGTSENGFKQERDAKGLDIGKSSIDNTCPSKDPVESPMKFPPPVNSERDVKLPSRRDPIPKASFSRHRNDIQLGSRDDGENFSRFNRPGYRFKTSRPPTRIGDRIRKLLTSKYWKVAPKVKDFEHSKADGGMRPLCSKRKTYYNYDRYQYDAHYKRRKFFSSIVTSDCNSPEKVVGGDKGRSATMSHAACGIPPLLTGNKASHQSKESRVKFSIKSFKIPELYVEVPESATVGSLKITVMEAVTALLGGGICVGVLLQGKKVRDDNRTLLQTGISCEDNLDSLGFTLEPGPEKAPPPVCSEEPPLSISSDKGPRHLTRCLISSFPATPVVDREVPDVTSDPLLLTNSAHPVDINHKPVTSQTDEQPDQSKSESRAIVPVSALNVEALAVIPASPKAVEELGTGRWRNIKLRAFENAYHRTYVDLKDKWKTLVHTAKISPQQRRGEPVPQELLDRVLAAHAYWSQHQAKQQGKHQPGALRITDGESDGNGVATTAPADSM
ncbi:Telomeric DNA binding protein 1, putative isoform 2 [Hibiscus syriacus]|uniref:Telomeric DNA binding protein 1, putative isoform 2 n=1 Tax=Hibiscus syriacus TaxID=106335 RepID=A0A6A2X955_HIBSY|nr:Telomeric DNA binding protein 1, putative isoform 2 [Hibiscus syriacus]